MLLELKSTTVLLYNMYSFMHAVVAEALLIQYVVFVPSALKVGHGLQLDLIDLLRESDGTQALVEVRSVGIAANNCQSLGISSKTILEEICQLALTIRNTAATGLQLFNHVRENA